MPEPRMSRISRMRTGQGRGKWPALRADRQNHGGTESWEDGKWEREENRLCRAAGEPREACGVRPACWRFRATHRAPKREQAPPLQSLREVRLRLCSG